MNKFVALLFLLPCLAGCEQGRTVVVHTIVNGQDVIFSKVHAVGQLATFRCISSQSGDCHYTVLANDCAPASAACAMPPKMFAVHEGDTMSFTSLPQGFQSCVTPTTKPDGDCAQLAAAITYAAR
ncbi:MAG TPA: hypothetical protein VFG49_13230 [Dyella sp.]|uniref:hypothetical protein n=1 Tax=Dyella sp. TaxID=1869338 RepID=UPI002D77EAA3|nr:hypothetical protein [Dyella sp.]HET6554482.1 hypothetical protein [Dyella sp.]